jgi:hypothetical protein
MASQMEKTLFNMKFTAKQLEREARKSEKRQNESDAKALDALKKNDEVRRQS